MFYRLLILLFLAACVSLKPDENQDVDWFCHRDDWADGILQMARFPPLWLGESPAEVYKREWLNEQIRLIRAQQSHGADD